jgi:hypothetical protein
MGIHIGGGAQRIIISRVTSKNMWGDGFYVSGARDVKFCSITADNNRRQGLSIIDADGIQVMHSLFKNTRGTRPSAGIDLEPDNATQSITKVQIRHSKFLNNAGAGVEIAGKRGVVSNVEIKCNVFEGNLRSGIKGPHTAVDSVICLNQHVSVFRVVAWFLYLKESRCAASDASWIEACA